MPSVQDAQRRANRFERRVQQWLKRYHPRDYAPSAANILFHAASSKRLWVFFPPHLVLYSIEANCAYHRDPYADPVPPDRIRRILNDLKPYFDPYLEYVITKEHSLDLLTRALAQQQFPLQKAAGKTSFARYFHLFVENDPVPGTNAAFHQHYQLNISDWMYMSFAVYSYAVGQKALVLTPATFIDSTALSIPRQSVRPFLLASSQTPEQIGQHYLSARTLIPPHLHIFAPSTFIKYPLVRFEEENFLVPHPHLMLNHASERLFDLCTDLPTGDFSSDFGKTFEKYIGRILKELDQQASVFSENDIQKLYQGKACDYLLAFGESIVLIECKATRYSSRLVTKTALQQDNSTGKVAEGYEQILATANKLHAGQLDKMVDRTQKKVYGFVVTFGELLFTDSLEYIEAIRQRMDSKHQDTPWYKPLSAPPEVISIATFEQLVLALSINNSFSKMHASITERRGQEYISWYDFTETLLDKADVVPILPFLNEAADKFGALFHVPNNGRS